jgi:hypothetical protein
MECNRHLRLPDQLHVHCTVFEPCAIPDRGRAYAAPDMWLADSFHLTALTGCSHAGTGPGLDQPCFKWFRALTARPRTGLPITAPALRRTAYGRSQTGLEASGCAMHCRPATGQGAPLTGRLIVCPQLPAGRPVADAISAGEAIWHACHCGLSTQSQNGGRTAPARLSQAHLLHATTTPTPRPDTTPTQPLGQPPRGFFMCCLLSLLRCRCCCLLLAAACCLLPGLA